MSLQFANSKCGHMETDDAPCNCYMRPLGLPVEPSGTITRTDTPQQWVVVEPWRQGGQVADPLAWMDETGHTNERTKHEKEWIAVMRKRFSDAGGSGTGDYCMWLEERLYGLAGGTDVNPR